VITARCGARLGEIEFRNEPKTDRCSLSERAFGEGATLGGMIARGFPAAPPGGGRAARFVLGVKIMDGRGSAPFGGRS